MYRSSEPALLRTNHRPSILESLVKTAAVLHARRVALLIALSASVSVSADYQQTLAARGADAYASPPMTVEINNQAVVDTFANNMLEANPALSDQEVMVDLQARMQAEQRLEHAAANLDPAAVTGVVTQGSHAGDTLSHASNQKSAAAQEIAQANEPESTSAAVASR